MGTYLHRIKNDTVAKILEDEGKFWLEGKMNEIIPDLVKSVLL